MKFTVMGPKGFIGSHLVNHLIASGHQVYAPNRDDSGLFTQPLGHVVYAVGLTADFRSRPLDTVQAHVCLLREVLEKARFESFLYLSSTRIYAGQHDTDEAAALRVEPLQSGDLYNLSKLLGESLTLHCGRANARVARLSNVIGGQSMPMDNFVPAIVRQALSGRLLLETSLDSAKDYIDIADVVRLLPQIAMHGQQLIYNVASGINLSHRDWVETLATHISFELSIKADAPTVRFPSLQIARLASEFERPSRSALNRLPEIARATAVSPSSAPRLA